VEEETEEEEIVAQTPMLTQHQEEEEEEIEEEEIVAQTPMVTQHQEL
jgi:hypothetical protein